MSWAWLAISATGISSRFVLSYPEAPVAVRFHPDHIVRGELSEGSKNAFTEHLIAVSVFNQ
ncbi:hypothetical protein D3C77_775400 [compost metagenome]